MKTSHWRLASLWVSHVARVSADQCLGLFLVFFFGTIGCQPETILATAPLIVALAVAPGVLLAPLLGALTNSLPKPSVLRSALALGFCTILAGMLQAQSVTSMTTWCLLAMFGSVAGCVTQALLPAATEDCRVSTARANSLFDMGTAAAAVIGWLVATHENLSHSGPEAMPVVTSACLYLVAFLFALPVRFVGDSHRPESPAQALRGFFRDGVRIGKNRDARGCLVGMFAVRGFAGILLGSLLSTWLADAEVNVLERGLWLAVGLAGGSLLLTWQRHPRRVLASVPAGATGLAVCLVLAACQLVAGPVQCLLIGAFFALVNVPLTAAYQDLLPPDARGNGMALRQFTNHAAILLALGGTYVLNAQGAWADGPLWVLVLLALLLAGSSWWLLLREVMEQVMEVLILPLYRISGQGPGLTDFPRRGPVLVVANHSSWFDPMWVGKVVPRRIIPLMTSLFFDLPGMRWLMTNVARAIRVEQTTFRREVPELEQAIAALDRGETVVVFPEGALRKREETPLKMFGQGVWHILEQRPLTPVVVCWIEGGWGSFCSYFNGPPTKGKRMDFWRPIRIGISAPQLLSPEVLHDHRRTRLFLMHACLQARALLGLEPFSMEIGGEEEMEHGE